MTKKTNVIAFDWVISSMDCAIKEVVEGQELQNVVNMVHWRRTASEGVEGEADYYFADVYGAMSLETPNPNDFVLYENLTEADVEVWLNRMEEPTPSELDLSLTENIELQKNPVEETLPNPWIV
tara:strand:+ start:1700 stop:2071 length:372 start_codon:yes stop_codon:yes gene_type:complete